jgi:hypothetical protein
MATSESYVSGGTVLSINGEAGADYAFSMEGIANAAGRVSAQVDLGAAPRQGIYAWSCEVQFQATPTAAATLDLYISRAPDHDNTQMDADIGVSDAALADVDMRSNLHYIGSVVSENATASEKCVASGEFAVYDRYISIVGYNDSGATINATDSNFLFKLTPKAWQGQAT